MELELKHLAAYLPHEIEVEVIRKGLNTKGKMTALQDFGHGIIDVFVDGNWDIGDVKPCLNPIGKLTLSELEDGAQFPKSIAFYAFQSAKKNDLSQTPYFVVEYLLSQHYDIFDLISKGLAVEKQEERIVRDFNRQYDEDGDDVW